MISSITTYLIIYIQFYSIYTHDNGSFFHNRQQSEGGGGGGGEKSLGVNRV